MSQSTTQPNTRQLLAPGPLGQLWKRAQRASSVLRFGTLSVASFSFNLGLTILLHEWIGLTTTISFALAVIFVYVFNFLAMRFYVFPANADSGPSVVKQATAFLLTSAAFRGWDYGLFLLMHVVFGLYYIATIVIVSGLSFVLKYFFYKRWVFSSNA